MIRKWKNGKPTVEEITCVVFLRGEPVTRKTRVEEEWFDKA